MDEDTLDVWDTSYMLHNNVLKDFEFIHIYLTPVFLGGSVLKCTTIHENILPNKKKKKRGVVELLGAFWHSSMIVCLRSPKERNKKEIPNR